MRAMPRDRQTSATVVGRLENLSIHCMRGVRRIGGMVATLLAVIGLATDVAAQTDVVAQCRCRNGSITPIHCDTARRIVGAVDRPVNGNWYESAVCTDWCDSRGGVDNGGWNGLVVDYLKRNQLYRGCDIPPFGISERVGPAFNCTCMDGTRHRSCAETDEWTVMHSVCTSVCGARGQLHDFVNRRPGDVCETIPTALPQRADACHCDTDPPSATVWCVSAEGFDSDAELSDACRAFCRRNFNSDVHHSEPDSNRCLWLPVEQPTTTSTTTTTTLANPCDNDIPGILDDLRCLIGIR